jgi:hypothetical protein
MSRLLSAAALLPLMALAACTGGDPPAPAPSAVSSAPPPAQAVPAADKDLEPLFGIWGLDPAACDQTLTISETRFEGAENGCDIRSFNDNGDGSYTAALSCGAQGQTADEQIKMRPVFAPTGEGVELTYLNRDNLETLLLRCEAPAAN